MRGSLRVPIGTLLDLNDLRMVQKTVQRRSGEELVVEEWASLWERSIGCDDHRALLIALPNHLIEVQGLVVSECPETEVVKYQQVLGDVVLEPPVEAVIASGCV